MCLLYGNKFQFRPACWDVFQDEDKIKLENKK